MSPKARLFRLFSPRSLRSPRVRKSLLSLPCLFKASKISTWIAKIVGARAAEILACYLTRSRRATGITLADSLDGEKYERKESKGTRSKLSIPLLFGRELETCSFRSQRNLPPILTHEIVTSSSLSAYHAILIPQLFIHSEI